MKLSTLFLRTPVVAAAFGAALLAGCDAATSVTGDGTEQGETAALSPYLADPAVGDLWGAKLDEFSNSDFSEGGDELSDAYGLIQVKEVSDDSLVVITESGAWPRSEEMLAELQGDLAGIVWDESEMITVDRADLAGLVEQGHILETRRMGE